MEQTTRLDLVTFLKEELALPAPAIDLALRQSQQNTTVLPMILWQYGLVTLTQLDQIFDWLERF
jgi:Protein of unknown function (DUF2949)